jgi:DNA polymerase I
MSKLIVINTSQGIKELTTAILNIDILAFDVETTGVHKGSEIIGFSVCVSEDEAYYVILKYWDGKQLQDTNITRLQVQELMEYLKSKQLVMHNGTFDCFMVETNYQVSLIDSLHTDTMILAHLLDENRRVGLKELARNYFGENADEEMRVMKESITKNGGKVTKNNYELYKGDAQLIAKYGAKDALLTYKLFLQLLPELEKQGLIDFFYNEESMPLLRGPTYQLNTEGLRVDVQGLTSLKKQLEAECLEAQSFIYKEIDKYIKEKYSGTNKKNTFNIGSPTQLSWLLFEQMKLEFGNLTKEGKTVCRHFTPTLPYTYSTRADFIANCKSSLGMYYQPPAIVNGQEKRGKKIKEPWCYIATDKKTLIKYADKFKWIKVYLERQKNLKILNTYVIGIQNRMRYGVIQPSFLQHGTTSGRYSSRNPNFQNLPRGDKRVKSIILSRPGKVFVGADYSQLEPRVFAYTSNDKNLLEAFKSGDDFYSVIGMGVYNKTDCHAKKDDSKDSFAIKYAKLRDNTKVLALATVYGASARQLASGLGKTIEATAEDINNYLERFPGVKQMMLDSHNTAKKTGKVINLFGRPRRMPEATRIAKLYGSTTKHEDLPYEARTLLNLATNHCIQSTAASIVNRAAIKFHEYCKKTSIDCKLVLQVHDSLVIECDEKDAENVSILLQDAMENTVDLKTVQLEAVPKIGKNLSEV